MTFPELKELSNADLRKQVGIAKRFEHHADSIVREASEKLRQESEEVLLERGEKLH